MYSTAKIARGLYPSLASNLRISSAALHQGKFGLADKYLGLEKNVWVEFIQLALEYQPLNLGQGLPDDLVPKYVVDNLSEVVNDPSVFMHQYTRGFVSFIKL